MPSPEPSDPPVMNPRSKSVTAVAASTSPRSKRLEQSWVGQRLAKYQIIELLGIGGMSVVLRAHDESIGRDVAVKILPAKFASNHTALTRFVAEAKSAGKVNHQNVVAIHEIIHEHQTHYIVMASVSGGSTEERIAKHGAYTVLDATRLTIDACQGLSAAHSLGLVHRDTKLANLLISEDGSVKISDFGLAKQTGSDTLQITQEGKVVGTPHFMSPGTMRNENGRRPK